MVKLSRDGWCTCRKRKEEIFIAKKTCSNELAVPRYSKQYQEELQVLVQGAQQFNQNAIDTLCEKFKPLILKEAKRESVYISLGEDAVNTAWTIFLSFIYRYNGANYKELPGLIQCHLYYELNRLTKKENYNETNQVHSEEALLMQTCDPLEETSTNFAIMQILKKLTVRQSSILKMYYDYGQSNEQIAKFYSCSVRTIKRQKAEALSIFRENLNT